QELVAGLRIAHRGECAVHVGVGVYFFFASRRRHTRSKRDWSSDVCSSDLAHFASWCCITVLPLPKGPGTAATPPLAMGKKVSITLWPVTRGTSRGSFFTSGRPRLTGHFCTMVSSLSPLSVAMTATVSSTVNSHAPS